jgi:hypothetical protein
MAKVLDLIHRVMAEIEEKMIEQHQSLRII